MSLNASPKIALMRQKLEISRRSVNLIFGLVNVDRIRSREMVGLLIDFLTESRAGLVSLRSPRRMKGYS